MDTQALDVDILDTLLTVVSFLLGAIVGSFLNVCVYRLPKGESIVHPRSRCPQCQTAIAWHDNIPMVSWLLLGARCRHCKAPISWQYPLVEAITAVLFACVYIRFGMTIAWPVYMLLAAALVLVTFVDLTDWTIPNEVTFPGIPLGLVFAMVAMFYPDSGLIVLGPGAPIFNALIGMAAGGGLLYLLDRGTVMVLGKRGMGFGDVKLLAMLGAFFGWPGVIMIIVAASFIGSAVGLSLIAYQRARGAQESAHYLPFGPYLSVGGLVVMFFGQAIYTFYVESMNPTYT
ncbi:MAG: prepilin peptidase [Candidatus Hydrogenedentota bacterium]